ncbi:MAG: cbb3-type cytochrome oxidase assembly protein CcoS [Bacteroidetes bacterium]|nr:cbb3-type cytochrome oxidase assembly protein CcoS [Bacteroidota bacterium]
MSVIILLIIIGIIVAGSFLVGFIWAVKSGQYDDTYSPAVRMLFDDAKPVKKKSDDGSQEEKTTNEAESNDGEESLNNQ